jgi:hypothetical protein
MCDLSAEKLYDLLCHLLGRIGATSQAAVAAKTSGRLWTAPAA